MNYGYAFLFPFSIDNGLENAGLETAHFFLDFGGKKGGGDPN